MVLIKLDGALFFFLNVTKVTKSIPRNMSEMDASATTTSFWSNPVDHFRINLKWMTIHTDIPFDVQYFIEFEQKLLSKSYLPWWTPFYFAVTHLHQRNRNLHLAQNPLNYRPYKYRANTLSGQF